MTILITWSWSPPKSCRWSDERARQQGSAALRLPPDEARARIAAARVARLATASEDGAPHIVPITFEVDGDLLYSAVDAKPKSSRDLRRLRNIRARPQVAVLADHYDEEWSQLWWARADGTASLLGAGPAAAAAITLLAAKYPPYRESRPAGPVICVRVHRWSGWAASGPPEPHLV